MTANRHTFPGTDEARIVHCNLCDDLPTERCTDYRKTATEQFRPPVS